MTLSLRQKCLQRFAMKKNSLLVLLSLCAVSYGSQAEPEPLLRMPELTVDSSRIANPEPVGSISMPVSALRFDPKVDAMTRNLAEGQADVSIRGGIFENTGFKLGALSLYDPQTGHYFAEIPVAPNLLSVPSIITGVDNAASGFNASVGTVAYSWRPIMTSGLAMLSAGDYSTHREELYQGYRTKLGDSETYLGADFSIANSESDGTVPYGDHHFERINGRFQLQSAYGQTDLFAGYQHKFFGWPNLYTPYGVKETENLQTSLVMLNHRKDLAHGDFLQAGAFWRRNRDDYEYNRFIPGQFNPYMHSTWVTGFSIEGRQTVDTDGLVLNYSASAMFDRLKSTSLIYGRFNHRDYFKLSMIPEYTWKLTPSRNLVLKAGGTFDDTNKDASALSPVIEIATVTRPSEKTYHRIYLGYSRTTQVATYTALNSSPSGGLFRGNPNLNRTSSHNIELGTSASVGEWKASAATFWRDDKDLVDWTFLSGPNARAARSVDVTTLGFEAEASRAIGPLELALGYTIMDKNSDYGSKLFNMSFYAMNYAKQRVTAAIIAHLGSGIDLRMDNEGRIQDTNFLRTGPKDAVISSIGLSWRPPVYNRFLISFRVDNLWDTLFQEVPSVPASRRQYSVGLASSW
jgi:vitamin B12 transporter